MKARSTDAEDHTHDLHPTNTAQQHYGLDASMLNQLTQESMAAMLDVSERWHGLWQLRSRFQEDVRELTSTKVSHSSTEFTKVFHTVKRQPFCGWSSRSWSTRLHSQPATPHGHHHFQENFGGRSSKLEYKTLTHLVIIPKRTASKIRLYLCIQNQTDCFKIVWLRENRSKWTAAYSACSLSSELDGLLHNIFERN